ESLENHQSQGPLPDFVFAHCVLSYLEAIGFYAWTYWVAIGERGVVFFIHSESPRAWRRTRVFLRQTTLFTGSSGGKRSFPYSAMRRGLPVQNQCDRRVPKTVPSVRNDISEMIPREITQ